MKTIIEYQTATVAIAIICGAAIVKGNGNKNHVLFPNQATKGQENCGEAPYPSTSNCFSILF